MSAAHIALVVVLLAVDAAILIAGMWVAFRLCWPVIRCAIRFAAAAVSRNDEALMNAVADLFAGDERPGS